MSIDRVSMLECSAISKHFGALRAVHDVSFVVHEGETVGIGGPNGAGKTTMFDVISGLQKATSGSVRLAGEDVSNQPAEALCHRGIARTFQLNAAFESMTALENVRVAAYFGRRTALAPGLWFDTASRERAYEALDRVGMARKAEQVVGSMPVLDRKLVMLAGALVTKPRLLMMDEPVGGLTPPEMALFEKVIRDVRSEGVTLVLIEHVMKFLLRLVDRMLIMHQGELIFDGSKDKMLANRKVVEVYLGGRTADALLKDKEVSA
jgi:branched-chain amino acid transport system ATP-binding protein